MDRPKILLQLDSDLQPSAFDSIVALDAGVDQLLPYYQVDELNVVHIVHGAIFTRGPQHLSQTAIFIGGSDVALGERLLKKVAESFFGPLRVSVMLDSNGSNTTAAAAVLSVLKHQALGGKINVSVLGGSGPVGRRITQLCAQLGARVQLVSRDLHRAKKVIEQLGAPSGLIQPVEARTPDRLASSIQGSEVIVSAGPAGVEMLPAAILQQLSRASVVLDLNAVPPAGIGGVLAEDRGMSRDGRVTYGAIGVGSLKMKIHRRAVQSLFEANDRILDTLAIFELAQNALAAH
jgi:hypothetical protein